jgi:hypothetical protein
MANLNCPIIGVWTKTGTAPNTVAFLTDGTVTVDGTENTLSFLVWEKDADHKLVTLDDGNSDVKYDFTYTSGSPSTLVISGTGALAGSYTQQSGAPAPLDLGQLPGGKLFIGSWIAQTPGSTSWIWNMQYVAEGLVTTTHLAMNHTFPNAYIIRGDALSGQHYIYGEMRFASGVHGVYKADPSSGYPTVTEDSGTVTEYTPTSTRI